MEIGVVYESSTKMSKYVELYRLFENAQPVKARLGHEPNVYSWVMHGQTQPANIWNH